MQLRTNVVNRSTPNGRNSQNTSPYEGRKSFNAKVETFAKMHIPTNVANRISAPNG